MTKFNENVERDRRVQEQLRERGWDVMVVWECETRDMPALLPRLKRFSDKTDER